MIKVSIILPVYNTQDFLEDCLNSIVNQTLKDIEVIVVNDGSPDDSQSIIDKFAKDDKRIKPFIKENGGLSDARNFGMEKAKGKYIWFIDSDDFLVDRKACEKLYNFSEENKLDVAVCDFISENKKGIGVLNKKSSELLYKVFDGKTYLKESYRLKWARAVVWINFYNAKFLKENGFKFEVGKVYEDLIWTPTVFLKARRVMCFDDAFYYYRYNFKSITKTAHKDKLFLDKFYMFERLKTICSDIDDDELRELFYDDIAQRYVNSIWLAMLKRRYDKEFRKNVSIDNIECSKKEEYGLVLYKRNSIVFFFYFFIIKAIKKLVRKH